MKDNMYQKMDPIKKLNGITAGPNIQHNVNLLTHAYIINNSADAYLPKKYPVQS